MKTIKAKVATLIATTSLVLIVAILSVSLTVMKKNVVTYVRTICMIHVYLRQIHYMRAFMEIQTR